MVKADDPLPGRSCGGCSACCVYLVIEDPNLVKPLGTPCRHLTASNGCGIYDKRFPICRTYHCLWRSTAAIADAWRPDRSGVLLQPHRPTGNTGDGPGIDVILTGTHDVLAEDRFAELITGFVAEGTGVHLVHLAGTGGRPRSALVNGVLGQAVAAGDVAGVKTLLAQCWQALEARG